MKKLILPLIVLTSYASNGQFSVVPEVGVESFNTTIKPGNFSSFSPLGQQFAPRLAVRMAYALKSGHGGFLGLATSSPAVEVNFTDPENANTMYTAASKELQLRFEGGYQFTTKPITLKKGANTNPASAKSVEKTGSSSNSRCLRSLCSRKYNRSSNDNPSLRTTNQDKGLYMRVKPSIGVAFAPSTSELTATTAGTETSYMYKTGLNTALIAGTAFEFGSREQARFIVGLNYLRSIGNNSQTITNNDAFKPSTVTVSSITSGFNVSLGIPLNFKKKTAAPAVSNPPVNRPARYGHCGRYKMYNL